MRIPARVRGLGVLLCTLLVALGALDVTTSGDQRYDSLYVFGDSLVDIGNDFILSSALGANPAVPPSATPHRTYFNGRFSNGPVEVEYLWQRLSGQAPGSLNGLKPSLATPFFGLKSAVDFAFGGTGTPLVTQLPNGTYAPGLKGQVELFRIGLAGRRPSSRAVFAIATGANDYNEPAPMAPPDVIENISDSVVALYKLGARTILVFDLPDLGLLPADRDNAAAATALSQFHNMLLAAAISNLSAQLPDARIIEIDLNAVFALLPASMDRVTPAIDAMIPPGSLPPPYPPGFEMASCLFVNPASCVDVPTFDVGQQFLFWDIVHPTTAAHKVLGDIIYNALQ